MAPGTEVLSPTAADLGARICATWGEAQALLARSGLLFRESQKLRADAVVKIIETSRLLNEAFDGAGYGDWGRVFKDGAPDGLSKSNADRLRTISKNAALTDSASLRKLPWRWTTLATLASMPVDKLQEAIDRGQVTPDMTGPQAADLVTGAATGPREYTLKDVARALRRAFEEASRRLPKEQHPNVLPLANQIGAQVFPTRSA